MSLIKTILLFGIIAFNFASNVWSNEQSLLGDWKAELKVAGTSLPLIIHLTSENKNLKGMLDTPSQGGFGILMTKLELNTNQLLFSISGLSIHYEGTFNSTTGRIEGNFIQGSVYPLNFERITKSQSNNFNDVVGTWNGIIPIPNNPLSFVLHLKIEEGKLVASGDSPDQNSFGMEIEKVDFKNGQLVFSKASLEMSYTGHLSLDKKRFEGVFTQKGNSLGLDFSQDALKKKQ